jgi:uncharacterized protein (TIGR00290 family)
MVRMQKSVFCWSGGKDCMLALHEALASGEHEIIALLTTISEEYNRVSMHGVRTELLELQANLLGFPLVLVPVPKSPSNAEYERRMGAALEKLKLQGVSTALFGDIFLEDVREYREKNLSRIGFKAAFPLWKRNTNALARKFISLGYRAVVTCADTSILDASFSGREFDLAFLRDLPAKADACGENGEFHSFVYAGPLLKMPVAFRRGEKVLRENRFCFCDLVSGNSLSHVG